MTVTAINRTVRRPNFDFLEMGWREGDLLYIPKFDKKCVVAGARMVKYGRSKMYLTEVMKRNDLPNISKEKIINCRLVETLIQAYERTYGE